jgi:iron complex transport system substrate-binding protein
MDDTIDEQDIEYFQGILDGVNEKTSLADANYDGVIDEKDIEQIKLIIRGEETELTFVDVVGEVETIHKPVKRIIVLMSDAPEVLRALNADDRIVGATENAMRDGEVYFPESSSWSSVGTWTNIDYEAVLSAQPDVLIPYTPHAESESVWPSTIETKNEYKGKLPGVSIIALDFVTPTHFSENVVKLGYILGKRHEAEEFANWYDGHLNAIIARTDELSEDEKPRVFTSTYDKYRTGIPGSRYHEMMHMAGGINIARDTPIPAGGSTTNVEIDPEWVIEQNPDIIIRKVFLETTRGSGPCYSLDDPADLKTAWDDMTSTPELANVNAVKNGRVYTIANMLQTGPHTLIGLAYYVKWFHPEIYEDLDLDQIHQEYLTRFQGLDYNLDEHGAFVYHPDEHPKGR